MTQRSQHLTKTCPYHIKIYKYLLIERSLIVFQQRLSMICYQQLIRIKQHYDKI